MNRLRFICTIAFVLVPSSVLSQMPISCSGNRTEDEEAVKSVFMGIFERDISDAPLSPTLKKGIQSELEKAQRRLDTDSDTLQLRPSRAGLGTGSWEICVSEVYARVQGGRLFDVEYNREIKERWRINFNNDNELVSLTLVRR